MAASKTSSGLASARRRNLGEGKLLESISIN
jgi:hypothetical protein